MAIEKTKPLVICPTGPQASQATAASHVAVGDGALGFLAPLTRRVSIDAGTALLIHKTANVLDKMSKSIHPDAKALIHNM